MSPTLLCFIGILLSGVGIGLIIIGGSMIILAIFNIPIN